MKKILLIIFILLSKITYSQYRWYDRYVYREFQYGDIRRYYDVCGSGNLDTLKKLYNKFQYIGSGNVIYLNGVCNDMGYIMHFFIGDSDYHGMMSGIYTWRGSDENYTNRHISRNYIIKYKKQKSHKKRKKRKH